MPVHADFGRSASREGRPSRNDDHIPPRVSGWRFSGGFAPIAERLQADYGFDEVVANELDVEDGAHRRRYHQS